MERESLFSKVKLLVAVVRNDTPPDRDIDAGHQLVMAEITNLFEEGLAEIAERESEAKEVLDE